MSSATTSSLTIATYNIHDAVGSDRMFAPDRIALVLKELDADIIALQEIGSHTDGVDVVEALRTGMGYTAIAAPTRPRGHGDYGNCLLTRFAVRETTRLDLTFRTREARGAIDVLLDCNGAPLRVIATHLGLRPAERRAQIQQLLQVLESEVVAPTILMGDLNEWFLWGRPLRWLHAHFDKAPAPPTFPSRWPVLALDRIWVEPRALLLRTWVHATAAARAASDHLPLVARIATPSYT